MKKLVKNRVNIFDKLAFGISFIPFLCFCTMFTYYFNEGLVINGSNISNDGMYYVISELVSQFFASIDVFHILILVLLFGYQIWFIINVFMTKADKRKKKKTYDFGLFVLSVLLWASVLTFALIFVIAIWDFEWIMAWFIGLFVEYQPIVIFVLLLLILSMLNIFYNLKLILSKGMKKYLKECEKNDYQFTRGELMVGLVKIFIVLLFTIIIGNKMMLMLI